MRYVAHVAAVIGLLALGLALGDFASNPNVGGGVAIVVMLAVLIFALGQLYRPGGVASREPAPRAPREPHARRPSKAAPPAEEPAPQPRRRERPSRGGSDGVWAGGWDAKEADEARERRREERARRKGRG